MSDDKHFYDNIKDSGFCYREISIGDITFKQGQSEQIHRWYRLTPSYSPGLVRYFINKFSVGHDDLVFDPFSGRGTTAIECQKESLQCVAFDVNPLLAEVGDKSLSWEDDYDFTLFSKFLDECICFIDDHKHLSSIEVARIMNARIPIIHNVTRWWNDNVLRDLLVCREMANKETYKNISNLLWIVLAQASLDCANIHRNHPTISFDDDHSRDIDVISDISNKIENVKNDLLSHNKNKARTAHIFCADSVRMNHDAISNKSIDCVITSPPYPNRFSYIQQTRPQLHFMELLKDRIQATEIDMASIGGTWGKATSILIKNLINPGGKLIDDLSYFEALSEKNILMCNYATKYFMFMEEHIKKLREIVNCGFRGAYVVGNSRLSGVEIFTEVILGKIFERNGFKVDEIISFRKRGGRARLYETAIIIKA